jgi:hypothetical protein
VSYSSHRPGTWVRSSWSSNEVSNARRSTRCSRAVGDRGPVNAANRPPRLSRGSRSLGRRKPRGLRPLRDHQACGSWLMAFDHVHERPLWASSSPERGGPTIGGACRHRNLRRDAPPRRWETSSPFTTTSEKCAKVPSWEIRTFRGAPAPVPTVGGEAVSRHRYWNEPERGRALRRVRAADAVRRRGARVLPARPVISVRSSRWDQPRSGLAGEPSL